MVYFRLVASNDQLVIDLEDAQHRASVLEYQISNLIERWSGNEMPDRVKRELKTLNQRLHRRSLFIDHIMEEQYWRENPEGLIADYTKAGYKLQYTVGNKEFDTVEEALSEARVLHMFNDVLKSEGPDGSWVDDMLPPEDMIMAVFV